MMRVAVILAVASLLLAKLILPASAYDPQALESHPRLHAARMELDAVRSEVLRSYARWAPSWDLVLEGSRAKLKDVVNGVADEPQIGPRGRARTIATQPLFRAFMIWDDLELAKAQVSGRVAAVAAIRADLIGEAEAAEARHWYAVEELKLRREFEAMAKNAAAAVEAKAKAKANDAAEVPRSLERIARAATGVAEAEALLAAAKARLRRLWGDVPTWITKPPAKPPCILLAECRAAGLVNPTVQTAIARRNEMELRLLRVERMRMPEIDAYASASRQHDEYSLSGRNRTSGTDEAEVGVVLRQKLPWGLEAEADRTQAFAELQAASASVAAAMRTYHGDVEEAWSRHVGAKRRLEAAAVHIRRAQTALAAIEEVYANGGLGVRDVLDAAEALIQAKVVQARAEADLHEAAAKLRAIAASP